MPANTSTPTPWPPFVQNPQRYYPTATSLPDGTVLVTGGHYWHDRDGDLCLFDSTDPATTETPHQDKWLVLSGHDDDFWDWSVGWGGYAESPMLDISTLPTPGDMSLYPHVKTLPFGLFYVGNDENNCGTLASESQLWPWASPQSAFTPQSRNFCARAGGGCVILTLEAEGPVRVANIGGANDLATNGPGRAEVVEYSLDGSGQLQSTGWGWADADGLMSSPNNRRRLDTVLLPDGKVLAIGGEYCDGGGNCIESEGDNIHATNYQAEILTPGTQLVGGSWDGSWSLVDSLHDPRRYHSVALLLPDGRVWAAGDEAEDDPGQQNAHGTYEIFYPPYLFNSGGTDWAIRPSITDAPSVVSYGLPFEIDVDPTAIPGNAADIDSVCIMRPGSVTHSNNFTQRRIRLTHTTIPGGLEPDRLIVSGPKDETYAPEGYYMLFIFDDGVPSIAETVKVERGSYVTQGGTKIRWGSDVWLDQDFQVSAGDTLEILPNTTVHMDAGKTSTTYVGGTSLIDVGIHGTLTADGATFTSTGGSGSSADWGGLNFHLGGAYNGAYGYAASQSKSVIENCTIENAKSAIRITDRIAPQIQSVTFTNNERDILVHETDAVIPRYRIDSGQYIEDVTTWDLEAPVNIVATQAMTPVGDALYGTSGKTNVIVEGNLFTHNDTGQPDERVWFGPDDVTDVGSPAAGNDWGGLYIGYGAECGLSDTDVGYASNPVFVLYPNGVSIRDCSIEYFADTGLWVYGSTGDGLLVEGTTIDRGDGLNAGLGSRGVFLDRATNVQFGSAGAPNTIVLEGATAISAGGAGIYASLGKTLCLASGPTEAIRIASTAIVGPGTETTFGDWSGVQFHWVCGTSNRTVEIESNWIGQFNFAGMDLSQAVDVQVTCNAVEQSRRGLAFSRDSAATGLPVRVRDNTFAQIDQFDAAAVATDASVKLKLGPINGAANKGNNVIKVWDQNVDFVQNDESGTDLLDATNNYWYLVNGSGEDLVDDSPWDMEGEAEEIDRRCRTSTGGNFSADATTDVSGYRKIETGIAACSDRPAAPGASRAAGAVSTASLQTPADLVRLEGDIPRETRLGQPFPNPTFGGITIPFALSRDHQGDVRVDVFDVTGRRVRSVTRGRLSAARYELAWPGVDESGKRVSPGTYFVRLRAGEYVRTTKITVLR